MGAGRAEIAIFGFSWIGTIGLAVACASCRRQLHYTEKLVPNLSQTNSREATPATPTADVTHPTERLQGVRPRTLAFTTASGCTRRWTTGPSPQVYGEGSNACRSVCSWVSYATKSFKSKFVTDTRHADG